MTFVNSMERYCSSLDKALNGLLEKSSVHVIIVSFAIASVWSRLVFDSFLTVSVFAVKVFGVESSLLYTEVEDANFSVFEVVLFAPFLETLIHQGVVQSIVSRYLGPLNSLIINVFLFSTFHLMNDLSSFIGAIGSGIMFFVIYEHFLRKKARAVGLVWVFLAHTFWNASLLYSIV